MGLLDPIVCRQARELIQAGKLVEAVRLLTASPDREHRAARRLLLELHDRLVSQAAELLEAGSLQAAWQAIEHAAQCGNLEGQALDLRLQIAARLEEARRKQQWNAQRLEEARRLADAGRIRTALGKLTPIEHPDAHLLRLEIEERLCRFERYLQQARKLIDDNQPQLARPILQKAARILPHDPALLRLLQQCPEVQQPLIATPPAPTGQPTCWAFGSWAWVVLGCEVVLGRAGQSGVHVPLSGGLRRRHALVIRDAGHYRLVPCLDSRSTPCPVRVNDQPVEQPVLLRDRDRLVLGEPGCTLIFRLPVGQSSTAVLQSPPGEPPPVHTARRRPLRLRGAAGPPDACTALPAGPFGAAPIALPSAALAMGRQPAGTGGRGRHAHLRRTGRTGSRLSAGRTGPLGVARRAGRGRTARPRCRRTGTKRPTQLPPARTTVTIDPRPAIDAPVAITALAQRRLRIAAVRMLGI
jgi:hypothetical protein